MTENTYILDRRILLDSTLYLSEDTRQKIEHHKEEFTKWKKHLHTKYYELVKGIHLEFQQKIESRKIENQVTLQQMLDQLEVSHVGSRI